jgi:hypothetical protein
MDRSARNPASLPGVYSNPQLSPTEQDVYATAHLFHTLAKENSHNTHPKVPLWPIQIPSMDVAGLYQLSYISLNHST